jgi:hypothetical protein
MTRFVLVLLCLAMVLLAVAGMRRGWRARARRQAHLPAPPTVPVDLGAEVLPAVTGLYVGTAFATSWQDRVVHAGLGARAAATLRLYASGVVVDRVGEQPIFIPSAGISGARLAPGLAGRVVGVGGLLVVTWRLGDALLDTGFRADDKTAYPAWVRALSALSDGSALPETANSTPLVHEIRHSAGKGSGR